MSEFFKSPEGLRHGLEVAVFQRKILFIKLLNSAAQIKRKHIILLHRAGLREILIKSIAATKSRHADRLYVVMS